LLRHRKMHRVEDMGSPAGTALATAWSAQIAWCDRNGAPFTARVLEAAWQDWLADGALRELMPKWDGDARADAVPLRVAGALHALVLDGRDPALAALYPPQRTAFDPVAGPPAVRAAIARFPAHVADYLIRPPQTNEIGRSAALLGAFATVAARTGLPLALCEIGASAGLNLLWDRYRYELGDLRWGTAESPVQIRADWSGNPPTLPARIPVAARCGCDLAPIDLRAPGAALRLTSYVWPEQADRLARLRAAIALATAHGTTPERVDAADFVAREFAAPRPGVASVLYHSIVWQYLGEPTRAAIRDTLRRAGERATPDAPIARIAFEIPRAARGAQLVLRLWPGGHREVLAEAHPHGNVVHWGAPA
jgi:hypothetical protein